MAPPAAISPPSTNMVIPGHKTCGLTGHRNIEARFGGPLRFHRPQRRAFGQTQSTWRTARLQWYQERANHLFQRCTIFGFWFAVRPCGMIIGLKAMVQYESPSDLLAWLDQAIFPSPRRPPSYIVYDRACNVVRSFVAANSAWPHIKIGGSDQR